MIFLEQRLHGTVNSITKFLSLLNCVDSVDACVTCVMCVPGYVSDMGQKTVWVQYVGKVNKILVWVNKNLEWVNNFFSVGLNMV